jgi:hypothetical protein
MIMSTLIRSALVALALAGSVSAASATTTSMPMPTQGKWKHDARAFFDQLKKNGS